MVVITSIDIDIILRYCLEAVSSKEEVRLIDRLYTSIAHFFFRLPLHVVFWIASSLVLITVSYENLTVLIITGLGHHELTVAGVCNGKLGW